MEEKIISIYHWNNTKNVSDKINKNFHKYQTLMTEPIYLSAGHATFYQIMKLNNSIYDKILTEIEVNIVFDNYLRSKNNDTKISL